MGGGGKSIIDVHLLMEVLFKQIGKKTFYTLEVYGVLLEVLNCTSIIATMRHYTTIDK